MGKEKSNSAFYEFLEKHSETAFSFMCLAVHLSYVISFLAYEIYPMAMINVFSVIFYSCTSFIKKIRVQTEKVLVASYYEITVFSVLCELLSRGTFGFSMFVVGTVSAVVYVTPSYKSRHLFFQITSIVSILAVNIANLYLPDFVFSSIREQCIPRAEFYRMFNIIITVCSIIYYAFFYNIQLGRARKELEYNSTHDILTGLFNRRYVYDLIDSTDSDSVAVALLDIDHFKKVNDTFGHDTGDDVLVSVSSIIRETAEKDSICPVRWGGEEFIMFFAKGSESDAYRIVSSLCSDISEKTILPDSTHVTLTAGISSGNKKDFDKLVKQADTFLYEGKQNGRNCIVYAENVSEISGGAYESKQ